MSTVAPYLSMHTDSDSQHGVPEMEPKDVEPKDMVPELSRSARSLELWAALHSLGKNGLADLVNRCCQHAELAARLLSEHGFEILNDLVLNQIVVSDPQKEQAIEELTSRVCASGETWFGITRWQGRVGFRLSFSSWVSTDEDVKRSVEAIIDHAIDMNIISKPFSA